MLSAMMQQHQQQHAAESSACAYAYAPPPLPSASPSASAWQHLPSPSYEACLAASPAVTAPQHRARRVATKRRPRPSRRMPTTYIRAGPAEFRRMVHQVTGADDIDLLLNPPPPPQQQPQQQAADQRLRLHQCRPAPVPAAGGRAAVMLPTLDTSASFLLDGCRPQPAAARTEAPPPPPPACEASLDLDDSTSGGCAGFPTLESWDLL